MLTLRLLMITSLPAVPTVWFAGGPSRAPARGPGGVTEATKVARGQDQRSPDHSHAVAPFAGRTDEIEAR